MKIQLVRSTNSSLFLSGLRYAQRAAAAVMHINPGDAKYPFLIRKFDKTVTAKSLVPVVLATTPGNHCDPALIEGHLSRRDSSDNPESPLFSF